MVRLSLESTLNPPTRSTNHIHAHPLLHPPLLPSSLPQRQQPHISHQMPAKVTSRWSETSILICLVVYRAINACLVKTYFSPDEYWQALEVGHKITFGYGYLTWEWDVGLRSVLHPAFFAALYKVLDLLGLDDGSVFVRVCVFSVNIEFY